MLIKYDLDFSVIYCVTGFVRGILILGPWIEMVQREDQGWSCGAEFLRRCCYSVTPEYVLWPTDGLLHTQYNLILQLDYK